MPSDQLPENKPYDKIIKENLEATFLPFIEKLLGIQIVKHEALSEKFQTTQEREADFVRIVEDEDGNRFILHIEFQSTNESGMVYRAAEYKAMLLRKYKIEVRQFVVYIGKEKMNMRTHLYDHEVINGFELVDITSISHRQLLASDIPEEILLAFLGNLEDVPPIQVLRAILEKLKLLVESEGELHRYLKQLQVLSRLRKLEEETKIEITNMPITYDIKTDGLYLEGKIEGKIEMVKNLLNSELFKEGLMNYQQISDASGISVKEIQRLHRNLV